MFAFVGFVFGTIIGSFLNVLILRRGARSLGGRSSCSSCGRTLVWYELVPVISWLALRGRCRTCGSRISIQYPLVETLTGIVFATLAAAPVPLLYLVFAFPLAAVAIAIATYDIRHTIIPDSWAAVFGVLALGYAVVSGAFAFMPLWAFVAGPFAAFPFFFLWAVSRGRWMGLGDAKLALGTGWLLGIMGGIEAVLFSFVFGALVSVLILLPLPHLIHFFTRKSASDAAVRFTMESEVPFGPFLVTGTLVVWMLGMYGIEIPLFI